MRISFGHALATRAALGLAISLVLSAPADAQSSDHEKHTQSMSGMQMPMPVRETTPAVKKKPAPASAARKIVCPKSGRNDQETGEMATSKCTQQQKDDAEPKHAAPVGQMDHSKMEGMDHSDMKGMDNSKMEGMDHSDMKGMDHSNTGAIDHSDMKGMDHSKMEDTDHSDMKGRDHSKMEGMDHSDRRDMDHSNTGAMDHSEMTEMNHSQMDMGSMNMQGGSAPVDARDPDYSDGVGYGSMSGMDMADDAKHLYVLLDNLEYRHNSGGNAQAVDAQAWYGGDRNKLWLKLDGERSDGRLGATRTEALWNRAISTYWGTQVGVRHDLGEGSTRDWAAFGVQGLAPYWFDLEATAYVGQSGRTALRLEAEYELLLTQRLVLQPDVEVNLYGKNDPERGIGSGLSDIDVGVRLRYEITRKFAPYVGVVWLRKFGDTAHYARAAGGDNQETQLVAGFRIWF